MRLYTTICLLVILFLGSNCDTQKAPEKKLIAVPDFDPLPSWNDGKIKQSILDYVKKVTDSASADFIAEDDRIATFDNDGTLWSERPYVQELFAMYRVKEMVQQEPALAKKQPFKAVVENDKKYFAKGGEKVLMELVNVTHTGMTEDEFESSVTKFFSTAKYPGKDAPINKIVYQPQLELLSFLRSKGFKVFICTGGTLEFVRAISEQLYAVHPDQVIGTSFNYKYDPNAAVVVRQPGISLFNDKEGKPVGIQLHIGKRPVFACGNEGGAGDIAMLSFSQSNRHPSFQMLINHDDSLREYSYQEKDSASLKAAAKNNWHVVSMKDDWRTIYPTR